MVRVAVALVLISWSTVGCGSDAAKPTPTPDKAGVPASLVGGYSMRLGREPRGADAPKELTEGSARWRLDVAAGGGPDDGPALTISNAKLGSLESSALEVKGDHVLLHAEECAARGAVESDNRYSLSGDMLTFTTVNGRPDKVAETILTAGLWAKQS